MRDLTREIGKINLSGDVIHPLWFQEIRRKDGRPHLLAIMILANVVYWYQPIDMRDEKTGVIIPGAKRFPGDMLRKSYDDYAEYYAVKKDAVVAAFNTLEDLGLVFRHFKTEIIDGQKMPNVMFLAPDPRTIMKITHGTAVKPYKPPKQEELKLEPPKVVESRLDDAKAIMKYLNDARQKLQPDKKLTGFRLETGKTMRLIRARFKDGYEVGDFKKVIDWKCKEWGKTDMKKYIQPDTLFTNGHFGTYLTQAENGLTGRDRTEVDKSIDGLMG